MLKFLATCFGPRMKYVYMFDTSKLGVKISDLHLSLWLKILPLLQCRELGYRASAEGYFAIALWFSGGGCSCNWAMKLSDLENCYSPGVQFTESFTMAENPRQSMQKCSLNVIMEQGQGPSPWSHPAKESVQSCLVGWDLHWKFTLIPHIPLCCSFEPQSRLLEFALKI